MNHSFTFTTVALTTNETITDVSHDALVTSQLSYSRVAPYSMPHLLSVSIALGFIILATVVGNVFVIAAIILERNLQCVANYLIASLAVADLMVAALVMPLAVVDEISKHWFLGPELCDMFVSFDVLCCTSSIWHLVAIALDRYWAVTRVNYIRNRSARRILSMIVSIWIISAFISIPPLFGWRDPAQNPHNTGECLISQDWGYTIFSTAGAFYVPLFVMLIIYLKIFQAARSRIRRKKFKNQNGAKATSSLLSEAVSLSHATTTMHDDVDDSVNGSPPKIEDTALSDTNYNSKSAVAAPASPLLRSTNHILQISKALVEGKRSISSPKKHKETARERLEQKRERKAARTLGIITGSFVLCWLPFFVVAIVRPFCGDSCVYPNPLIRPIIWLGYINSLLNPIIYTIFNPDFRLAFHKILFGKYRHHHVIRR